MRQLKDAATVADLTPAPAGVISLGTAARAHRTLSYVKDGLGTSLRGRWTSQTLLIPLKAITLHRYPAGVWTTRLAKLHDALACHSEIAGLRSPCNLPSDMGH
jgi:hypothetical protein